MTVPIDLKRFQTIRADKSAEENKSSKVRTLVLFSLTVVTIGLWLRFRKVPK